MEVFTMVNLNTDKNKVLENIMVMDNHMKVIGFKDGKVEKVY